MKRLLFYSRFSKRYFVAFLVADLTLTILLIPLGYLQWRQDHPAGLLISLPALVLVIYMTIRKSRSFS